MTTTPHRLTLHFANDVEEAPRIARRIEHFLHGEQVDASTINKILLCVDELVTNIIGYAYSDSEEHAVLLECRVFDNKIELELRDDGQPFNPTKQERPNLKLTLDDRKVGGLGIHLVKTLMDKVDYRREGDFNVLTVTKMVE